MGKKMKIGPETILRRNNAIFNELDGEVVILSVSNSEYYGMDKIGSHIWQLISEPISIKQLCEKLVCDYDVTEYQCYTDTVDFIHKLVKKDLVIVY